MLYFASDYQEGAHPAIMERLCATNLEKTPGYGTDAYCESARQKIRLACDAPDAAVHFLVGGTQTNATVIRSILKSWQGVISADSGHIATHEAGAIELGGHKVLTLPHTLGKISAEQIEAFVAHFYEDGNWDHMVAPGMVYLSHPTEFGTLYSLTELEAISAVCRRRHLPLFIDGARLGYGLASRSTDVTLKDLARLADVFYIGGTKVGALFGEAVVITNPSLGEHFFTVIKQNGALLAKGRLLGIQFDTLFTDDLYLKISRQAIDMAEKLKEGLRAKGYRFYFDSPSNQQFIVLDNTTYQRLSKHIAFAYIERVDDEHTALRLCTSWATTQTDVDAVLALL